MKRIIILFVAAMCLAASNQVQGQNKGEIAAGVQFAFGAGSGITNIGVGAKFQWNVIDRLRIEPSFNYFFKKDLVSMWDFNANVHYQFVLSDKIVLYPLAGLSVLGVTANYLGYSASGSEFGLNVGGGVDFQLTDKWVINIEPKYKISGSWGRFVATAGVVYKF